jgi:predicted patatin/cPLA2 family phospholipase
MSRLTSALVVEGGAMRGIFAAGVLDSFMDNSFKPYDFCIGVSAGSTNLAAYLAGQRGRSHKLITDYSCRPDFINFGNYVRGRHLIDLDWLWKIAYREYRLDSFAYGHQKIPLWVVTTNVVTGKAEYHLADGDNLEDLLLASCAVPFAYRGFPAFAAAEQTDGGVADSIPVQEAYRRGARDITVILSQPANYRKKPFAYPALIQKALPRHPNLAQAVMHRASNYNAAKDFIEKPPSDCAITVIAPDDSFAVKRLTRDPKKLNLGYEMGVLAGQAHVSGQDRDLPATLLKLHADGPNCGIQEQPQS